MSVDDLDDFPLIPGLRDQPERRYLRAGHVAHLLPYATDYAAFPYAFAFCRRQPEWPGAWLGSGSQNEADRAGAMPLCIDCRRTANEIATAPFAERNVSR